MTTRTAALAATLAAAVLVAGCTGSSSPGPTPSGAPSPSSSAGPVPTAVPLVPSGTPAATGATTAVPFPANTLPDTGQSSGAQLGLRAVRSARQAGYDRVVFELAGPAGGQPGWRVEYVDRPTSDGSGNPVAVTGPAYLRVVLTGVGIPADTGVPEPAPRRFSPAGTEVVREVVLDGVFEGYYTSFVGLRSRQPFRVFRLADPPRVVVDVRHS